ncbi:hypothetical protein GLE_0571 [Lysobacter enzymogenes]|uniref:Uncharacterized protein n=1 Tax=Lysobacter enzymogenes TaxID=69 RepID=A0A0S2DBM8_LYSEN|nr:hypothetical protein GLE_0571 [Lysobacter enzymogenes]
MRGRALATAASLVRIARKDRRRPSHRTVEAQARTGRWRAATATHANASAARTPPRRCVRLSPPHRRRPGTATGGAEPGTPSDQGDKVKFLL